MPPAEETGLQIRIDGDASRPCLIYLPGVHGDWTLLTSFREIATQSYRLMQVTYPRTVRWTIEDYAREVAAAVARLGIKSGWVLAESFSSQVAWAWLKHSRVSGDVFRFSGIIRAGGFVRYPLPPLVRLTGKFFDVAPWWIWKSLFRVYFRYSRFRHRNAPASAGTVSDFIQRRTPLDIAAMRHRLALIADYDPRTSAASCPCPVYLLAGIFDPVVPVWPVLKWLRKNCAQFRAHRIVWPADHNVLGTEPAKSLGQIKHWIEQTP